jgi:hypothetical protein
LSDVYTDPQETYSLRHPADWTVEENATLPPLNRVSKGVAFVPPASMTKGTAWMDGMVFLEKTDGQCPEIPQTETQTSSGTITIGENTYSYGATQGVGAGNLYLMDMYTIASKNLRGSASDANACFTFTLYQHRCTLGLDCGEAHAKPFDDTQLRAAFHEMLGSFRLI